MALPPGSTVTVAGITAKIVADGYEKGISQTEGPWRKIIYQVAWDESDAFLDGLIGYITIGTVAGPITFPNPHHYPGNTLLVCTDARARPIGAARPGDKLYAADYCHIEASYNVPIWDQNGTETQQAFDGQALPYTDMRIRGYTMNEPLPAGVLVTKGDGDSEPDNLIPGRQQIEVPVVEMVVERYYVPYMADDFLADYVGKINQGEFLGKQEGTVRFDDYDVTPQRGPSGEKVQTYTYRFLWRPVDWNAVPVAVDGKWLWDRGWDGANYSYVYVDLNPVLTLGL